jgi:hypothetical protein
VARVQSCEGRKDVICSDESASWSFKVNNAWSPGVNDPTNKNPRPKPGVLYSPKRSITSAGCSDRLAGCLVRASGSAAGSADQASAGHRLVARLPDRLADSTARLGFDCSGS